MVFPQNALEKLGFSEIKNLIREKCLSGPGREMVDKIRPQAKIEQIDRFLRQTYECKTLISSDSPLPVNHMYPIRPLAERAKVEGAFLSEEEFLQMLLALRTAFAVIRYFSDRPGAYPNLELLVDQLPIESGILRRIESAIDERGKMKDNASALLIDLTGRILQREREARNRIDQVFKLAGQNGWTADGNLTVRDGRLCIPILAENKRKIKGWIHDESATGQTAYIEPEEVFHLNNQIRDLEFERRRETVRILTELTAELRPQIPLLMAYHGLLAKLDFVRAKALFAIDIEAEMPELSQEAEIQLVNARHPLLFLHGTRNPQAAVVPLNIKLDERDRIVLVSGPNAGGKSVCLKTVGLLQLMVQSGLLIPADPESKVGVFRQFFADIGDDQSIESDLSTYSAHLSKMKHFTESANGRTLVLMDEFGTGTDPLFGGPIAEAVLEALNRKRVRGVITTHYSNLKVCAANTPGLENASMLFDNVAMRPLYILQIGKPGSSYAFEMAEKIGLGKAILEAAKGKIGQGQQKVDTLLVDLERDKKQVHDTKIAVSRREKDLQSRQAEYERLHGQLEENKKQIIREAKEQAREILRDANRLVENTIAAIRSAQADREQTKAIRKKLHEAVNEHTTEKPQQTKNQQNTPEEAFEPGDWVRISDTQTEAQVLEVSKGNNLVLALGDLRTVVKKNRAVKLRGKEKSAVVKKHRSVSMESVADFRPEVDVRGMRTDDALRQLEAVLDRAVMIGYPSLKILHGKGDGILRKFVREYLRKYSHVSRIEDEHADRGGDGITYAYIGE